MGPGEDLKLPLAVYFGIKQKLAKVADSRYIPWLVSLMNTKRFPENIKVLTWNYEVDGTTWKG